jgi:segregation and condensation protein B
MAIINPPPSMTLGRFVRVTLHNFRLLINTFSGSTAAPPMSDPADHDTYSPASPAAGDSPAAQRAASAIEPAEEGTADALPPVSTPTHQPVATEEISTAAIAAEDISAEDISAEDISAEDISAEDISAEDISAEDISAEDISAEESAAEDISSEEIAGDEGGAHIQPALNLATEDAAIVLAAATESGDLLVRTGEAALSMGSVLESLLFVADAPVEAAQLARVVNAPVEVVEGHLRQLAAEFHGAARGLRVAERNGRFQLVTAPAAAALIETFLNLDMTTKLSAPALETLAVVAYRQPVTRAQVEAVRGVDCSGILRSLLQRGLVEEVDRLDAPGRPMRYGVTDLFMQHFGLTGLHELPPLEQIEAEQLDGALEREA